MGCAKALALLTMAFGVGAFAPPPARGAATKTYVVTPGQARAFYVWTNYLAKGPQVWSQTHAPAFTPAIKSTIWQVLKTDTQAQSLANPMIDYLLWRQSLNPTRFARNHPNLSPALTQLLNTPTLPPNVPPPTFTPVPQTAVSPQTVVPPQTLVSPHTLTPPAPLTPPLSQTVIPPAVPEPNSLILAAGMVGWGLWWRRRMSRRRTD
jgi:hypothetical protein